MRSDIFSQQFLIGQQAVDQLPLPEITGILGEVE